MPARPHDSPPRAVQVQSSYEGGRGGREGLPLGPGGAPTGAGGPGSVPACPTSFGLRPRCPQSSERGRSLSGNDRAGRAAPGLSLHLSGNGVTICLPQSVTQVPAGWQSGDRLSAYPQRSQALLCVPGPDLVLPRQSPHQPAPALISQGSNKLREEPPAEPLSQAAAWATHLYSPGPPT